jgi:hypothetical protein
MRRRELCSAQACTDAFVRRSLGQTLGAIRELAQSTEWTMHQRSLRGRAGDDATSSMQFVSCTRLPDKARTILLTQIANLKALPARNHVQAAAMLNVRCDPLTHCNGLGRAACKTLRVWLGRT